MPLASAMPNNMNPVLGRNSNSNSFSRATCGFVTSFMDQAGPAGVRGNLERRDRTAATLPIDSNKGLQGQANKISTSGAAKHIRVLSPIFENRLWAHFDSFVSQTTSAPTVKSLL